MTARLALITGLAGPALTQDEARFLKSTRPGGIILFARNCIGRDQIRALVAGALNAIGSRDTLVLIDQEGGRVQRLRPPLARVLPPAAAFAAVYRRDPHKAMAAARDVARLVAAELRALAINTNCAPVLDVPIPGSHDIIGDRAYGTTPAQVACLAQAVADGLKAGGVVPVITHIPGHGRATADSHHELPVVFASEAELNATDFAPFAALCNEPAAMTAHVVYITLDPTHPATTSPHIIGGIIRRRLGFDGLLMSDDVSMKALSGSITERAKASIAAGCDVALHCNGELDEMTAAAAGVPTLAGAALKRFEACVKITHQPAEPFDEAQALSHLEFARNAAIA